MAKDERAARATPDRLRPAQRQCVAVDATILRHTRPLVQELSFKGENTLMSSNISSSVDPFTAYLSVIDFIDRHMAACTGAEVKVFLYIWRRTHGFGKLSDAIGLSQMCRGTKSRKTGETLDDGTGLHRETSVLAQNSLHRKEIIHLRRLQDGRHLRPVFCSATIRLPG